MVLEVRNLEFSDEDLQKKQLTEAVLFTSSVSFSNLHILWEKRKQELAQFMWWYIDSKTITDIRCTREQKVQNLVRKNKIVELN